jgi:hypothetical protein
MSAYGVQIGPDFMHKVASLLSVYTGSSPAFGTTAEMGRKGIPPPPFFR